jgi:hypothetical protein
LDDGGNQGDLNRPYHPAISRLPKSMIDSTYPGPGSDWSPPSEAVFPRRYCQAHLLKWAWSTSRPTLLLSEVAN